MRFLLLLVCLAHAEQVLGQQPQQGENRLILKDEDNPSNPCMGHVKIYHKGAWGYVGDEGWRTTTEEVVCRSAHCGTPVSCTTEDVHIPSGSKVWLNEMDCVGNESHPWDCSLPGWGVSVYRKDTVKKIKCANRISISLEGFKCAGTVQYSIDGKAHGYFCANNWGQKEADRVCESLKCGKSKDVPQQEWMVSSEVQKARKMMIQCSDIESEIAHLWQCVTQESATCTTAAFVECEGHKRLQLRGNTSNVCSGTLEKEASGKWELHNINTSTDQACKQMNCGGIRSYNQTTSGTELTCTDNVRVQLTDDPTSCYGIVSVRVNGSVHHVCATDWDAKDGEVVCRELNCGKVISAEAQSTSKTGIMDNANCSGSESSLWHCRAQHHNESLQCSSVAYVVCEKSLNVTLVNGPGRCAGRVQVWFKGGWKEVIQNQWEENNSNSVCRQLQCGDKGTRVEANQFSQGSSLFFPKVMKCQEGTSRISDCITDISISEKKEKAVGITCEEHKAVFLHGSGDACSGLVGIEHGNRAYWLSGSDETWNNDIANLVCQQRHCGSVGAFSAVSNKTMEEDVWGKFFNCSPKHKSLFECEEKDATPGYNATIANVTCKGNITITLSKGCWGNVGVTVNNTLGGVCADAWSKTHSLMLCKDLGCGDRILTPINRGGGTEVILKSLHMTTQTTKLSQCIIVKNDESGYECRKDPAYVVCSGSVKARLNNSRDRCSGNLEVFYDGMWLPVCKDALSDSTIQDTICEELQCGQAVGTIGYFGPTPTEGVVISGLNCPDLKNCNITAEKISCDLVGLQCSKWHKLTLSDSCSGAVTVRSKDSNSFVSSQNWTLSERDNLCNKLNCGTSMSKDLSRKNCANESTVNVTLKQPVLIECQDKPTVALSGRCGGAVRINGLEVCDTNWNDGYSHLVCHEQQCSNAIVGLAMSKVPNPGTKYYHVLCEDFHHKLGQCKRYKGTCRGKLVTVSCVKNVQFKTSETCGGHIQVNYQDNKWEEVCPVQSSEFLKKLCQVIGCDDYNSSINAKQPVKTQAALRTTLDYSGDHRDIRHSVRARACQDSKPADIYCNGYVPHTADKPIVIPTVPILLGVGVVVILLIVISIFAQIKIKKARNAKAIAARMLSQDMEFESGEFANFKEDEMENFHHDRLGPEAEVTMENDRDSASSFAYDDIDEATESQPLKVAGASGGSCSHEDQKGVTYEVEDPQENYDDIDASPGLTQTKADIHDSPQPLPGSPAAASQPPKQEDDYLVPGQDG